MFTLLFITILGLCVGSFLNVAIIRLPKNESINLPASHCCTCNHPLKWYHNIPLFSWLFLRGKCAFCHAPISWQYPIIELLSALLYGVAYYKTNDAIDGVIIGTTFSLLLALSLVDIRYKAVPDALSLPALLFSFFQGSMLTSFQNALLFMGAFSLLRFLVSFLTKKEAMGEADIIIAGIIGALLGVKLGCAAIYISAVLALIVFIILKKRGIELPFIPFLASGLIIAWFGDTLILNFLETLYE